MQQQHDDDTTTTSSSSYNMLGCFVCVCWVVEIKLVFVACMHKYAAVGSVSEYVRRVFVWCLLLACPRSFHLLIATCSQQLVGNISAPMCVANFSAF